MTSRIYEQLETRIFPDRDAMGLAAGRFAAGLIAQALSQRGTARVIFACAPSQNEFLATLLSPERCGVAIDWTRVEAFHMDEYVGFTASREESFRHYLRTHLLDRLPAPPPFHPIHGEATDLAAECAAYTALLNEKPIDLVCLGIGENGHLAFNDPPVASFDEAPALKLVELDEACRHQQVNDGCFPNFDAVPKHALTLTVPALLSAVHVCAVVPGPRKAQAVRAALLDPLSTACPASILRTHSRAVLHLDTASAALLDA